MESAAVATFKVTIELVPRLCSKMFDGLLSLGLLKLLPS